MSSPDKTDDSKNEWRRGAGGSGAGRRRGAKPRARLSEESQKVDPNNPVMIMFAGFREILDDRQDRNERIIKLTRDVTIESKRVIFTLHRSVGLASEERRKILAEAEDKLSFVRREKLAKIAAELKGSEVHQFLKSVTWGYQEYVEAATFLHYLKTGGLMSPSYSERELDFSACESSDTASLRLPPTEFCLGVADLTGELMRLCIMATSRGDVETPFRVAAFLKRVHAGFLLVGNQGPREMGRKINVLKSSLEKVERACYALRVRGSEIPSHMLADVFADEERDEGFEPD